MNILFAYISNELFYIKVSNVCLYCLPCLIMEVCLAEAASYYVNYLDSLQHAEVSNGKFTMDALPLVQSSRQSKKSFKEFFHVVPNISTEGQEVIRAVMSEDPLCISRLPNSVRPQDALGTSCHLQLVLHQHPDGSCTALKFYHSKVSIPIGLARTLCADRFLVIDYSLVKNSDAVKKAFLYMLSQISSCLRYCDKNKFPKSSALQPIQIRHGIQQKRNFAVASTISTTMHPWPIQRTSNTFGSFFRFVMIHLCMAGPNTWCSKRAQIGLLATPKLSQSTSFLCCSWI